METDKIAEIIAAHQVTIQVGFQDSEASFSMDGVYLRVDDLIYALADYFEGEQSLLIAPTFDRTAFIAKATP